MSEQTNYCTMKGLGWAFLIVTFFIVVLPWGVTYATVGHDGYARHCKMTPLLPCFGIEK